VVYKLTQLLNGVNASSSKLLSTDQDLLLVTNTALVMSDNAVSSAILNTCPEIVEDITVLKGAQGAALW
jgi:hypothetical protein